MIRINLLPREDRKTSRRWKLPTFSGGGPKLIWVVFALLVYVGMIMAMMTLQARQIRDLETKIAEAKREAQELAPQLEKIRRLTKEREEVNRRLGIIASLDRDRYFRVQLMNDIGQNVPSNCWLTSLKESGGSRLTIEGITFSNYTIADLMSNLEKSARVKGVILSVAQESKKKQYSVMEFKLETNIAPR